MAETLTTERLEYELRGLQGWVFADGRLVRDFTFADVDGAHAFERAVRREVAGHPADIRVSAEPAHVQVGLSSGGDGVTGDDIDIAHRLDALHGKT